MDPMIVKALIDITQWIGLAVAAGVVGNSSDRGLLKVVQWFRDRGRDPRKSWARSAEAARVLERIAPNGADAEALVLAARLIDPSVFQATGRSLTVYSRTGTAIGEVHGSVRIDNRH
jgi:hypothetical protein